MHTTDERTLLDTDSKRRCFLVLSLVKLLTQVNERGRNTVRKAIGGEIPLCTRTSCQRGSYYEVCIGWIERYLPWWAVLLFSSLGWRGEPGVNGLSLEEAGNEKVEKCYPKCISFKEFLRLRCAPISILYIVRTSALRLLSWFINRVLKGLSYHLHWFRKGLNASWSAIEKKK